MFSCRCCIARPVGGSSCKVPLKSVSFSSLIQNSIVSLSVTQVFQNEESRPLECEYSFKIAENSVVTSLKLLFSDGRVLTARVQPLDEALETYQDSIAEGNTATLAKLEDDEKMSLMIGNLAPGDSVRVEFSFVSHLVTDESYWKFAVPTDFWPGSNDQVFVALDVKVVSNSPIIDFSSNCDIGWKLSTDSLKLDGHAEGFKIVQQKELFLKLKSQETNQPACLFHQIGSKVVAMLSFIPFSEHVSSLSDIEGNGEFLFVLDRSGSMAGDRIDMAKQAAVLFLNSLPTGSLFNVISFGSDFSFMFPSSQLNTSENIRNAVNQLSRFKNDMGGTNIYDPLRQIFSQPTSQEYPRTIFLLTDGQVSSPETVISLIESNSGKARVHGFGISQEVDTNLIKNSAKAGKGCASFITDNKEIGKKVISALQKCIFPCVNSWQIDWQGESYPSTERIGTVYYGESCTQFVLLNEKPSRPVTVRYFDNFVKDFKEFVVSTFQESPADHLFKLWTKAKLDTLMLNQSENEALIKQISVESGIPTKLTSFVCVAENQEPVTGEMIEVKQPGRPTSGPIHILRVSPRLPQKRVLGRGMARCMRMAAPQPSSPKRCKKKSKERSLANTVFKQVSNSDRSDEDEDDDSDVQMQKEQPNVYFRIISGIESEGYWKYLDFQSVVKKIDLVVEKFKGIVDDLDVICTMTVLGTLQKEFQDQFDEWVLIERKAARWLKIKGVDYKANLSLVLELV